jgi:hypothetical protein
MTFSSQLPDANFFPSGLNATLITAFPCPTSGSPIGFWEAMSHSMMLSSSAPEARMLPSGLNTTALM